VYSECFKQSSSTFESHPIGEKMPNLVTLSVGCQLLLYPTAGVYSAETFCKKNLTI
jgi:hypothetical protein